VSDLQPDEVCCLIGVQWILPALWGPKIACEAGDECIAFDGDIEIEPFVIAKKKSRRSPAGVVEGDIFHLEPQVMARTIHFDVPDNAGGISPIGD